MIGCKETLSSTMYFSVIYTHVNAIVSNKLRSKPTDLSTDTFSPVTCDMYLTNQHELLTGIIFASLFSFEDNVLYLTEFIRRFVAIYWNTECFRLRKSDLASLIFLIFYHFTTVPAAILFDVFFVVGPNVSRVYTTLRQNPRRIATWSLITRRHNNMASGG